MTLYNPEFDKNRFRLLKSVIIKSEINFSHKKLSTLKLIINHYSITKLSLFIFFSFSSNFETSY
jgi:hypothetical protein